MAQLSHWDDSGASRVVDVSDKPITRRTARASGRVTMQPHTLALIREQPVGKGNVLEVARLAGIMASKRTAELIPLCHALGLDAVAIDFAFPSDCTLEIESRVRLEARTGAEMEALTAVSVAALTVYDMCKSLDRGMVIERIRLEEKSGGRSGHFRR